MNLLKRTVPYDLEFYRCLSKRLELTEQDELYYTNLEQGFQGECLFDQWLERLNGQCIVLNDLLLEQNNTLFQIDSLLITQHKIYTFEIKNYQGDFYIEGERWYRMFGKEIKSPLIQLKRSESLLRQYLQQYDSNVPIESYLCFINPHFFLYHAKPEQPIIYYPQFKNFFNKLEKSLMKLDSKQRNLAKLLMAHRIERSPFSRLPAIDYDQVKKGILCNECGYPLLNYSKSYLACENCGYQEKVDEGVLCSLKEYKVLFPNKKLTSNVLYQWCNIVARKTIRRVLLDYYDPVGTGKATYYVEKS
ncbi:nuclease-related domain-containing protein [Aquibacillus sediminis]|uniref:nuclease-related domain-containing protein n=1 Tax=Aquibacillus sediminis TaxID=2574734 RepID=UPI001109F5CB|nr:nuclease-related domain-containing protein [Aquibacillus sediminis]